MAEGSETPTGDQGGGLEGRPRRSEADLLAERRARRATDSGEVALTRRAEAAEATVLTLERHVASLQQRLREAEDERARMDELIQAERTAALEREHELRRVKQREYAEQQLRVEVEDRLLELERDSRVEIERLGERLGDSERDGRELALRLESVQRQLAEAEHAATAARVTARAELGSLVEQDLRTRLGELERRALEVQRGLDTERAARERSESLLEGMREGHRRMESLLGQMKDIVARASRALAQQPATPSVSEGSGVEMAAALASAVERLRARAEVVAPATEQAQSSAPEQAVPQAGASEAGLGPERAAQQAASAPVPSPESGAGEPAGGVEHSTERGTEQAAAAAPVVAPAPVAKLPAHKHSMSLIGRLRMKRKQRRGR
ncbi:MAG TPA: hypothetical protein VK272_11350 [Solirubrobacteraceae bacterium]|nr:hypothetical protein [Solirubrobacteraceae bacterium]HLM86773.1 hypothetical protein [Solirubrobacteraceae bacterium]